MAKPKTFKKLQEESQLKYKPAAKSRRAFSLCPRCKSLLQPARTLANTESEFWLECSNPMCNTYVNTYIPQAHQAAFHKDAHRFKGSFGGYGTGKTLTDREEFYKHMFITPSGNGLMGANIMSQYESTIKRDIENDIPVSFVASVNTQKSYIDFINGYRLMFRPFDDADKLRSLNLDYFLILEASEVKEEAYTQLKTRIRNVAATVQAKDEEGNLLYRYTKQGVPVPIFQADWRQGVIESNPDSGWIKSKHLQVSSEINHFGTLKEHYDVNEETKDPAISSFIVASDCNEFLPEGFIADLKRNKPIWWVARFVEGSFSYSEGLVYPNYKKCVVDPFPIPKTWKRIIAHDYGLVDPSVFLFGAVDEARGHLYIYKEVRATERGIKELAKIFKRESYEIPFGGLICTPIIDPKSGPKRDYNKESLITHYQNEGITFQPGVVNVDARILKTNSYVESGYLRIFNTCESLIKELSDYKFAINKNKTTELTDKPEDKNNHSINCLEWIIMELPADPTQILAGIYNTLGRNVIEQRRKDKELLELYALQDTQEESETLFELDYTFGGW